MIPSWPLVRGSAVESVLLWESSEESRATPVERLPSQIFYPFERRRRASPDARFGRHLPVERGFSSKPQSIAYSGEVSPIWRNMSRFSHAASQTGRKCGPLRNPCADKFRLSAGDEPWRAKRKR